MYKVIVVDDETWICKLIRKIVDWESLGFEIITDAGDGLTALNLIKEHRPDLVITDIRMPSLDGIGLIKTTREFNLDIEFIIISGYSDFEYARNAVKYDAFGYIVKPLDKGELQDILLSVKDKINKKRQLKTKIEFSESWQLENEIRKIINLAGNNVHIEELNKQYGTSFSDGEYCVAVLKQDFLSGEKPDSQQAADYRRFLTDIKALTSEYVKEAVWYTDVSSAKSILLFNCQSRDGVKRGVSKIMTAYRDSFKDQSSLTIGLGESVSHIRDIGKSYRSALYAVNARMSLGTYRVIDVQSDLPGLKDARSAFDQRDEKKLSLHLDVFDTKGAAEEIANILRRAEKELAHNPAAYHATALSIVGVLFNVMEKKQVRLEHATRESAEMYVENSLSKAKIEAYLNQMTEGFALAHSESRQEGNDKIIGEIKTYIMDNYMSDIGLDDVAKLVCLNPTYVSEVFKKKTGENFTEYLSDYRINIAKELLQDIRYKIIDVSSMVGYKDSKYFSRLFKKKVGVNPTDYRNLYI